MQGHKFPSDLLIDWLFPSPVLALTFLRLSSLLHFIVYSVNGSVASELAQTALTNAPARPRGAPRSVPGAMVAPFHHKASLSEVEGLTQTSLARAGALGETAPATVPASFAFPHLPSMIYLSP